MSRWLFAYGFRTFFAAAGVSALLLVPAWAAHQSQHLRLGTDWPPAAWHGHEMLFGFVCAAIGGFLLTAVPSWTRRRGFGGAPLVLLAGTWLLGRLFAYSSAWWPPALVAAADLAFLPLLAACLAPPLLRERNRNTPLLLVLLALWCCDVAFHVGVSQGDAALAHRALGIAVDVVLVLVTVVGGRLLPAVTAAALRQHGHAAAAGGPRVSNAVVVVLMAAIAAVDLARPGSTLAGAVAAAAAIAQAARVASWGGWRVLRVPLVGVLHVAYAWLPVGLALKASMLLGDVAGAAHWLHALTIGTIASLICGVMARVALGHTGRPLRVGPATTSSFALLATAALLRVFGTSLPGASHVAMITWSAALWTAAFALFLGVYGPMFIAPRVDGRPG